jgi:hypothetical protein
MRKFKLGLVALAATAAVAVPATSAMAGTDSVATTSSALGADCVGLVNVCEFSVLDGSNNAILSGINVVAAVAACPNVNVIGLLLGQKAECENSQHTNYKFIQRTK